MLWQCVAESACLVVLYVGKLTRYVVPDNANVKKNQAYCEIEVMKIHIPLYVPESGRLQFVAAVGTVLQAGDTVAKLQLDDPAR